MRETDTATMDPDAVLDWTFSWTAWLTEGDTITTATVTDTTGTPVPAITIGAVTHDETSVAVWLSAPTGHAARVTCRITTAAGRTDDRTLRLSISHR